MSSRLSARLRARRHLVITFLAATIPAATLLPFLPPLVVEASSTPTLLGEQNWYTLDRHQLWDKADLAVNVASGDLIFHEADLEIPGVGANNLILDRYYNSLSNGAGGGADFGSDWVMTAGSDVKLTIGTSITYQGPSSFQQVFTSNGSGGWNTPPGMDATLAGPNGNAYTLTYHNNGQVLTFIAGTGQLQVNTDRNGNKLTYTYYSDGRLYQILDVQTSRTTTFNYNGNGNVSSMVDSSLNRTYTYTINGSHNLTGYADPANPSKTAVFTYDTLGKHELVDIKDPAGNGETKLTYDTNHRVTELQFVYDSTGDTYNRTYTYNSGTTGSRCDSSLSPAGNTVVTDEDGHNTDYCWDSSGRVIQKVDGLGHSSYTTWNSDNKPLTIKDANGQTSQYQYNDSFAPNEIPTKVIQPTEGSVTGATTTYAYGASTNHYAPTSMTEPQGTSFSYTYDANGNPSTMVDGLPSHNTTTQIYASNGLLAYTLDAPGDAAPNCVDGSTAMTECLSYDSNGALSKKVTPITTDSYVNDAAARISTHTDGNSNLTSYTYDADNRITQILYGGATTCPSGASLSCTTFQYDADGNLTQMGDQTGTSTYTQDKLNRPLTENESGSSTTSYTHDGVGNLSTLTNGLGSSNAIHYGYDAANHLTSLWLGSASSTCSSTPSTCTTFSVDNDGNRKTTVYPSGVGVTMAMTYDNSDRLTNIQSYTSSQTLSYDTYDYNDFNTDTNLRQYLLDINGYGYNYQYDASDQVTQALSNNTGLYPTYNYSYTANADLCRTDGTACQGTTDPLQYNAGTSLKSWSSYNYAYDLNGNLKTITGAGANVGQTYNIQNQLGSECNGCPSGTTSYTYRGVGQGDRAQATGYDGTQTWTSDILGVSTETNTLTATGCTCYYVRDPYGTLIEEILTAGSTAGTYYPLFDGSGSVIGVVNGSGSVVDTFTYQPNGVVASHGGSVYEPWQFQGEYADNSQGGEYQSAAYQYHDGARYYEAGQLDGHWTQQDPLDSPFDTQGWNRYNYAGDNPVNLNDPNGLGGAPACGWGGRPCQSNWVIDAGTNVLQAVTNVIGPPVAACGVGAIGGAVLGSIVADLGGSTIIEGCLYASIGQMSHELFGDTTGSEYDQEQLWQTLLPLLGM